MSDCNWCICGKQTPPGEDALYCSVLCRAADHGAGSTVFPLPPAPALSVPPRCKSPLSFNTPFQHVPSASAHETPISSPPSSSCDEDRTDFATLLAPVPIYKANLKVIMFLNTFGRM
ncbi:hypothetical protein HDU84_007192 [Entophlyctis sp. JEL0112]|nr:hypothetical protein HDU84_007192 [Entophlyctis sp. JEL0112]